MDVSFKQVVFFVSKAAKPFKLAIFFMTVVSIIAAIDLSVRPYILKMIVDRISNLSGENIFESVGGLALIYFLMIFILSTSYRLYDYLVTIDMFPKLRRNIVTSSLKSLLEQSYSYYQNNFAGSLTNKANNLLSSIPEIIQIVMDSFLHVFLSIIIAIFILWQVNYSFAIIMFIWSASFILVSLILSKKLVHLADNWSECGSKITGKMVDTLSNIISINLFARKKHEFDLMYSSFTEAVIAEQKFQWLYFWIWMFYGYSFMILQGVNLYFLLKGRQDGWVTVGDFIVVLTINSALVEFLWRLAKDLSHFSKLWGEVVQALRTIETKPEVQDKPNAAELIVTRGEITFENVKFHYKGFSPLFDNKSITIKAGEKVGLVGYSGSGKTSFVNLILRLYEINSGTILIDNNNIYDITLDSLRNNIAMIPQDPSLFHRSVMENIRYGKIDASDEDVINAAKQAHAHDFIMNLLDQYNSLVGERGVKLSGGQRQRIAIARAFLKNSPILILDEATSQLDSITEAQIQESLWKLMQNKTTIVIAHRLSTLLHMDRILVFDKGKIVADGSHQDLLSKENLYKGLWEAQVGGFLPDK